MIVKKKLNSYTYYIKLLVGSGAFYVIDLSNFSMLERFLWKLRCKSALAYAR